jgi:predicted O-methyltransferase YrrM
VPGFANPPKHDAASIAHISEYNQRLSTDQRFQTTFLPIGDGVALSYRVEGTP